MILIKKFEGFNQPNKWRAREGINELIVTEDELQDPRGIVTKLNRSGWNLGSGHESVEVVEKKARSGESFYVLFAESYSGMMTQTVTFYRVN
jgi:hypothetical protein